MLYSNSFRKSQSEMLVHYHTVFGDREVKAELVEIKLEEEK